MKRIFLIILVLSISYVSSVYSEEKQSEPTLVTAPGFTNYQVQQNVTPEVFNSSGHIQETAPGLKSPYVGIFNNDGRVLGSSVDVPKQESFPTEVTWPEKPTFI